MSGGKGKKGYAEQAGRGGDRGVLSRAAVRGTLGKKVGHKAKFPVQETL